MPADLIKEYYKRVKSGLFKPNNQLVLASKIIESSALQNVSVSAMVVRLNHRV